MICSSCSAELPPRATFCSECGHRVEDPFVGTTVNGRYRIEDRIAVGGFGAIYRGTQLNIRRPVAIKIMHRDLNADANLVARFRREGVVLCNLRDAHTVTTYELDETADQQLFIVMELLEGTNLHDVFRATGRLAWPRVFAIARSVCSALAEAHALGIVHRDLKPANIYLEARHDHPDFVKVLDFGIAKVLQESGISDGAELTVMGQAVGTLEYMAPEQLMGGRCDARTDIYTLGVVAFEMITGQRPFPAVGLDLLTTQLSHKPPAASELVSVPPAVDRVLLRCLEQDASERFPDVIALARALDEVIAAEAPIRRTPTPWSEPTPPPTPTPARPPTPSPAPPSEAQTIPNLEVAYPFMLPPAPASSWRVSRIAIVVVVLTGLGIGIGAALAWL
jgi:serine/threonine protein kinase